MCNQLAKGSALDIPERQTWCAPPAGSVDLRVDVNPALHNENKILVTPRISG